MKTLFGSITLLLLIHSLSADEVALRIRFGITDRQPTVWDGSVTVTPGQVKEITGWRFAAQDEVQDGKGWKVSTRRAAAQRRTNNPNRPAASAGPVNDNGVIVNLSGVTEQSKVEVTTKQGNFSFALSDAPYGKFSEYLEGKVEVERVAVAQSITTGRTDDDYPAMAAGRDGTIYLAYASFTPGLDRDERSRRLEKEITDFETLARPASGDQLWLRVRRNGSWAEAVPITPGKGDIYKCSVAVDGRNRAWILWSENKNGNFDVWARSFKDGNFSAPIALSTAKGNDLHPAVAVDAKGRVWVAWQAARESVYRIAVRHQTDAGQWSDETMVSAPTGNCWAPAVAANPSPSSGAAVTVAWDTYEKGDYDIWMRSFSGEGKLLGAKPVANSPRYEARPSVTYDQAGNLWIAWEESGETWGKNWGALVQGQGIPLYADRQIGLRIWTGEGQWVETAETHLKALPGAVARRGLRNVRVPALEPESETRQAAREAQTRAGVSYNNISRLAAAGNQIWLLSRSRLNDFRSSIGSVWVEYGSYYNGQEWVGPILIPHSDDLLYNLPAPVANPGGGLLVAHSSDHRQNRRLSRAGAGGNDSLAATEDPFDNDIFVSHISSAAQPDQNKFKPASSPPVENATTAAATLREREDIQRCRQYRAKINGVELRILRGEFHRHTEISGDGGNDGPLEDMWRYAIDVAAMDWIGNGDHDNGGGREYPWWLTQKTTDAYHLPGRFDPLFTYERSVRYPEGHRNVVFARRGIRTLPRLPKQEESDPGPAPDTQMLYKYLRHFGGVCASHTSATDMGTDWRDHDPLVEPFVEIYQGCRQNYERPGAPRSPTENDAIGGWRPKGFINLALLKGHRLAFQASSDHRSTHISYACVYATDASREGILEAMKKRHTYAATDNIIADFQCRAGGKDYLMGDEFATSEPIKLKIKLIGSDQFARVVLIKDDQEAHVIEPKTREVNFEWTDPNPTAGKTSYYYVRGEQANGELVWASPMWIKFEGKP